MTEISNGVKEMSDDASPEHHKSPVQMKMEPGDGWQPDEGVTDPCPNDQRKTTDNPEGARPILFPEDGSDKSIAERWLALSSPLHILDSTPSVQPTLTKRRRTVLSIADKADLIRRMHNGESQRQLAFEYGIGTSTVSDVKKHEAEILRYVEANGDFVAMNRRKLEAGAKVDVEEAVFDWLVKEVRAGRELSAAEVMAKARAEHHRLRGNEEFRASTGWLERFKRRYNIRSFKPGEEDIWKPALGRSSSDDAGRHRRKDTSVPGSRKAQRIFSKRSFKNRSLEYLDRVFENSSPPMTIKSEAETHDEYDYADTRPEIMSPEVPNSFHPQVTLEEGHLNLDMPPVEEIPSAGEAATMLAKALVWAAAQPETAPQELFVLKQLQTKAALKCILKATH